MTRSSTARYRSSFDSKLRYTMSRVTPACSGDVVHRRPVEPAAQERRRRGADDLLAPLGARQPRGRLVVTGDARIDICIHAMFTCCP